MEYSHESKKPIVGDVMRHRSLLLCLTITLCSWPSPAQDRSAIGQMKLGDTLKMIENRMNSEGPVSFDLFSGSDERIGNKWTFDQSAFVSDAAGCKIRFHLVRTTQDVDPDYVAHLFPGVSTAPQSITSNTVFDLKPTTYAITPESVSVIDGEQRWHDLAVQHHHPEMQNRMKPQVWVVRIRVGQNFYSELWVHDKENADFLGNAFQRAIKLCNTTANEPF